MRSKNFLMVALIGGLLAIGHVGTAQEALTGDLTYSAKNAGPFCGALRKYAGEGASPFDLIWDIDDGTTSRSAAESQEVAISYLPRAQSTCTASVLLRLSTFNEDGSVARVDATKAKLAPGRPLFVTQLPPAQTFRERTGAHASVQMRGCTCREALSLRMVTDTYDALTGDTKASRQANPTDSFRIRSATTTFDAYSLERAR